MPRFKESDIKVTVYLTKRGDLRERQVFPDDTSHDRSVSELLPCEVGEGMISG